MNRKQMILLIEDYYKSIERIKPPQFREYSNQELKLVIILFDIKVKNE
jgi:hypothetical protein